MKKIFFYIIGMAFVIMFSINNSIAQDECAMESPEQPEEATNYVEGPLYIKLYLMVVRNDDGTGGWSDSDLSELLEELDQIYGVHDINFNICISDIKDSYWANIGFNLNQAINYLIQHGLDYDDGIIGVLQINGPRSQANAVPGKRFIAKSIKVAIHELGHNLGLYHTFNQNFVDGEFKCLEHAPYYTGSTLNYGDNASTTGDFVYDTPADITTTGDGPPCEKTGLVSFKDCQLYNPNNIMDDANPAHKFIDIEDPDNPGMYYLGNNIMNYGLKQCYKLITPGQAEKIRSQITLIPEVIQDEDKTTVYNKDFVITESQIWNDDRIIDGNITILGGELTLYGNNIYFTPEHGIKISPNSYLTLKHCTLDVSTDNNCYSSFGLETWNGILYDFTLSGNDIPWILMDDVIIKNAEIAISNNSYYQNPFIVLNIYGDSKFIDNKMAINLTNADGIIWIRDTDFEYNKSYDSPSSSQIRLTNSKALMARVNVLNTTPDVYFTEVNGLDIFNSNLRIYDFKVDKWFYGFRRGYGTGKYMKLQRGEISNSEIEGLSAYGRYGVLRIKENHFYNNYFGNLRTSQSIKTDLNVENSRFDDAQSGIYIGSNIYGYFYNNKFDNISGNALYFKNHGNITKEAIFLCNQMNTNGSNHIITYGGIFEIQANMNSGQVYSSAGNTFVSIPGLNFAAHTDIEPSYYYKEGNQNPVNSEGIQKIETFSPALCPDNPFDDNDDDDGELGDGDTSDEDNKFSDKKGEKDNAQDTLDTNLDGGNTDDIIDLIDNTTELTSGDVTQTLTDLGPWLSDIAAEELVQEADIFSGDQLVSIFSASPDVLMDPTVYQFALGEDSALTESQKDVLRSVYGTVTERTKLIVKIKHLDININHIINKAISKVVFTDDGIVDYDNLRMWFGRKSTFDSKFDISETYVTQGDFTEAVSYLQGVLNDPDLSTDQTQDINDYIFIIQLLEDAYQDQRYEGQLTAQEIAQLETIAESGAGMSQNKARGILNYFYGYTFEDDDELENRSYENKHPRQSLKNSSKNIKIYPNPNTGEFVVTLMSLPVDISIKSINVTTLDGKTIIDKKYDNAFKTIKIRVENVLPGIYMYNVFDTSGKKHTGKLMIK
jgi:hypothetical protein